MPVDTTKPLASRRTPKNLTEEELQDIERKRLRGELSCAECRRLKLKCDKKLPCSSCERRGCESICPLGILAAGQGTRFILADTEQLHAKIYQMSNRIRQLEDALAILQSTGSDQRHPLLTDEQLKVKFGSEVFNGRRPSVSTTARRDEEQEATETVTTKSLDALGTLTLGSSGEEHYFGRSAGSEALMLKAGEELEEPEQQEEPTDSQDVLANLDRLANLFPFASTKRLNIDRIRFVESLLPSQDRAVQLCRSYIDHGSYFFRPIKKDELLDELCPFIFDSITSRRQHEPQQSGDDDPFKAIDPGYPHALATLCFVLALGALFDLKLCPYNSEAERYYDLGKAALSLKAVFDSPSLDSVRAMGLMATYHTLGGIKYTRDSAWCLMSFAAKALQSIGLHRDSARWNMDPRTVQKRRNLFWEVFSSDVSHSLALGRPPAIHLSYVDCEFPQDEEATLSDEMEHQDGFWRMKHTFARDMYNSVAEATLTARTSKYPTILDLDKKVREVSFPKSFNPYVTREVGPEIFHSSSLALKDFYASQNRTVTMLYLHRSFFAQAMLDHPSNPLLSPFAPSFLTAYRSASVIIKAAAHLFERCEAVATRVWFLMYHMFSAAIIVGTIVTRSPTSNFTSIAMKDFNAAVSLFERASGNSQRAKIALGVLLKLREQADRVYEQISSHSRLPPGPASPLAVSAPEDDVDHALAIFGGQMRVLERKSKGSRSDGRTSNATTPATSGSVSSPGSMSSPANSPPARPSIVSTNASPVDAPSSSIDGATTSAVMNGMNPGAMDWMWNFGFGTLNGGDVTMENGTNHEAGSVGGPLPDVHPSLIEYLNNDAVRRALSGQPVEMVRNGDEGGSQSISYGNSLENETTPVVTARPWSISSPSSFAPHATTNGVSLGSAVLSAIQPTVRNGQELGLRPDLDTMASLNDLMSEPSQSSQLPGTNGTGKSSRPVQFKFVNYTRPPGSNVNTTSNSGSTPQPNGGTHSRHGSLNDADLTLGSATGSSAAISGQLPVESTNVQEQNGHGFYHHQLGFGAGFQDQDFLTGEDGMPVGPGPTMADAMDRAGALEFGLSSESWMDAGWVSFMRDCGLMNTDE